MASKTLILAVVAAFCFGGAVAINVNTYDKLKAAANDPNNRDIYITADIVIPKNSPPITLASYVNLHG